MKDKKTSKARNTRISQAPEPSNPIASRAYPPKKSKPADYQYWNLFPLLSVHECVMLMINVEPGTPIRSQSEKDQYKRILYLAQSYRLQQIEPFTDDHIGPFTYYQIEPDKFIEWARSKDLAIPDDWRPCAKPDVQHVTTGARWICRRAPGNKWEVGHEGKSVFLKGGKGFEDFAVAVRTPDRDCLKVIIRVDPAENIPTYGSDDMMDNQTATQIKRSIAEISESLQLARSEGKNDLVDEYEQELQPLTDYQKQSTQPGFKPKRLDKGDPTKSVTNRLSNRRRTFIQSIRKAGFGDIADHVQSQFKVADRSVIYYASHPAVSWILDP